jgi:hypothetical protein
MNVSSRILRVLLSGSAILFFASHAESQTAQSVLMPPNTSASPTFVGLSNGTLAGSHNVSKVNVHTLLYPGNTTKVLVHYLPWWNGSPRSNGLTTGYRSNDPTYINKIFTDLTSRGVDGVVVDWYGQTDFTDVAWQASMPVLAKFPKLSFSIMIDAGSIRNHACAGCDINGTILYNLDYMEQKYFPSSQYVKYNGYAVVTEFAITSLPGVDWARIQAAHPEIYWVHLDNAVATSGFDITSSAGSFLWIDPPPAAPKATTASMAQPNYFYTHALTEPAKVAFGAAFSGFNNSLASWNGGTPQAIPQTCGATWLSTFSTVNKYYSASKQLPFLQLVTWDDYEEGTALEPGIDNCATVAATVSNDKREINVNLTHVSTVDHLELYSQSSTGALNLTNTFPATMVNIPISGYTGTFFLKAVGKPFIKNVLSSPIVVK